MTKGNSIYLADGFCLANKFNNLWRCFTDNFIKPLIRITMLQREQNDVPRYS